MKKVILLLLPIIMINISLFSQSWQELGTGSQALKAYNGITSLCLDTGGIVYAAGFSDSDALMGGHLYVEKWDGVNWGRVGPGSDSIIANGVNAMCMDAAHNLYVATSYGSTADSEFVAKWDGTSWSSVGTGSHALHTNSSINSICADNAGNLYAAGAFTDSAVFPAGHSYVAKWNGISWSELGTGSNALNADAEINSIIADAAGNVYAAGDFRYYPGGYAYVAKWNGTTWSELGSGSNALNANATIWVIDQDKAGNIYAGGFFTNPSGDYYVAQWNDTTWNELGSGSNALNANDFILSICADDNGNIYAGGNFNIGGKRYVAKWNGITWTELGTGSNALNANGELFAVRVDTTFNIYTGGSFTDGTGLYGRNYVTKNSNPYVGIQTLHSSPVKVFPDPATEIVNITIPDELVNKHYSLSDATGKILTFGVFYKTNMAINISEFPSGIYLLRVTDNNQMLYKILKR